MEATGIIMGVILSVLAIIAGVYASYTVRCKGKLLSNPWILMTKEEIERKLSKEEIKAECRQITIVMGGITLVFGYFAAFCFSIFRIPLFPVWIIIVLVAIYAIISSIKFAMRDK
jgi:hypothetical protein